MKKTLLLALCIGLIAFSGTFAVGYSIGSKVEFSIKPEAIIKK